MTLKVSILLAVSGGSSLKMSNLNHFEKYFLLELSVKLRKKRKWVKQCLEKGALRVAEFFPYDGTMVKTLILIMRSTEGRNLRRDPLRLWGEKTLSWLPVGLVSGDVPRFKTTSEGGGGGTEWLCGGGGWSSTSWWLCFLMAMILTCIHLLEPCQWLRSSKVRQLPQSLTGRGSPGWLK